MASKLYARSVRRVEGEAFWDTLKDVATNQYYNWVLPFDEKPELRGRFLWHSEKEMDGWEALLTAIISLAARDYVEAIVYNIRYKREDAESYLTEWAPEILNRLQEEVKHAGRCGVWRLLGRMKVMW